MSVAPACALLKAKKETWSSKTAYDWDGRVIETRMKLDGTREMVVENKFTRLGRQLESLVNDVKKSDWAMFDEESRPAESYFAAYNAVDPTDEPTYTKIELTYWERGMLKERVTDLGQGGLNIREQWDYDLAGRQWKYRDGEMCRRLQFPRYNRAAEAGIGS
jgi:hypothetical protein